MPTVSIGKHPELTPDQAMAVFAKHFAGKYQVYKFATGIRDFAIKASDLIGVSVKLRQEANSTSFLYSDFIPSTAKRIALAGIWFAAANRAKYQALMDEVATVAKTAPEFKAG